MSAPLNPSGFSPGTTGPFNPGIPCSGAYFIDVLAKQPAGTFTQDILKFEPFRNNWWYSRIKRKPYPMHLGPSPLRRVQSRQRGGDLVPAKIWTPSNGDGSANANIAAGQPIGTPASNSQCVPIMNLNRGYLTRGMNTFNWGSQSRAFSAKDFNQSLDPVGDLELEFEGYGKQIGQQIASFQRNEYVRLCTTKVYNCPGTGLFGRQVTSTVGDPTKMQGAYAYSLFLAGVNPTPLDPTTGVTGTITDCATYLGLNPAIKPTSQMNQDLGNKIVRWLSANGVDGISSINGAWNYEFVTDPVTAENMLRDVSNFTTFQYADMGKGKDTRLLEGLGSMQVFRNHAYQVDEYAIALDATYTFIPAPLTVAADNGTEDIANPAYFTAPYRISVYYTDDVYNVSYPETAADPGGNVSFNPYGYMGDLRFIRFDTSRAPLQDAGWFYSEILVGSWAAQQRFGVVVIHLGCNVGSFTDCYGVVTTY